jgi:hypothetical protein
MLQMTVNKVQLNHIFACLANLNTLVTQTLHKGIPEQSAIAFADLLKNNIASQKGMEGYPKLKKWKNKEENPNLFWKWTGEAVRSIKHYPLNEDTWYAGFGFAGVGAGIASGGRIRKSKVKVSASKKVNTSAIRKKPGETTQQAISRRDQIAASVKKAKNARRTEHKEAPPAVTNTRIWSKEEIARLNAGGGMSALRSTVGGGRSFSFGQEPKKYKNEQMN